MSNEYITPEVRADVLRNLIRTRSPFKTARKTGVDLRTVLRIQEEERGPRSTHEERHGGWGQPDLRDYVVARKKAWEAWKNDDPPIANARRDYELGIIEMTTGRDGEYLILYAIPREVEQPRPDYFSAVEY